MINSRPLRVLRGVTAATVATFIALVAHVSAGAPVPGAIGLLVPWIFSVLLCTLLVGRRVSLPGLAAGVTLSQMLFHLLFVLGTTTASALSPIEGGIHVHGLSPMPAIVGASGAGLDPAAETLLWGPFMWAAHAIASIVTTALLHSGERFVVFTLRLVAQWNAWLARWIPRPVFVCDVPLAPAASTGRVRGVADAPHLTSVIRRGPPVAL